MPGYGERSLGHSFTRPSKLTTFFPPLPDFPLPARNIATTEEKEKRGTGDCRRKGRGAMNLRRRLTLRYSGLASNAGLRYIETGNVRRVTTFSRSSATRAGWRGRSKWAEELSASMPPASRQNIAAGMNEASVLMCHRSNEIHTTITCEKQPYQRAGSKSKGLGLGSVQGIQVSGLFGRDRQMDKLLYREEIDGFRQNNRMIVS